MELIDRMAFTLEQVLEIMDAQANAYGDRHLKNTRGMVRSLLDEHPSPQQRRAERKEAERRKAA